MLILSEPSVKSLIKSLDLAIERHNNGTRLDPFEMHNNVKSMYNWHDVAKRTNIVYDNVVNNAKTISFVEKILQ